MSTFWNEKYQRSDFLYGVEPNAFIKENLDKLKPGKILFPAEGEGRNAVFAALQGWQVTAFDPSNVGKQKALKLANDHQVVIEYILQGYQDISFEKDSFDVIAISFGHMPSTLRKKMHQKYFHWLKPGGTIIAEVFSKDQLNYKSGGPKDPDMLLSQQELNEDFKSLSFAKISTEVVLLNEGIGHQGKASVTRMLGIK